MRVTLLAIAVVVVASVEAFAMYHWAGGTGGATRSTCGPAPVPADAQHALAAYAGRIQYDVTRAKGFVNEKSWTDPLHDQRHHVGFDSAGHVTDEFGSVRQGRTELFTTVTYPAHNWLMNRESLPASDTLPANKAASIALGYRTQVVHGQAKVSARRWSTAARRCTCGRTRGSHPRERPRALTCPRASPSPPSACSRTSGSIH